MSYIRVTQTYTAPDESGAFSGGETSDVTDPTLRAEIARRAYELWKQDGCRHGEHERHWFEAERHILGAGSEDQAEIARPGGEATLPPTTNLNREDDGYPGSDERAPLAVHGRAG